MRGGRIVAEAGSGKIDFAATTAITCLPSCKSRHGRATNCKSCMICNFVHQCAGLFLVSRFHRNCYPANGLQPNLGKETLLARLVL